MAILDETSIQDRKRLLELFPVSNLRQVWAALKGTKEEICYSLAEQPALIGQVLGWCLKAVVVYLFPSPRTSR